jgi:DNA-binding MarR family transcriptional regulator
MNWKRILREDILRLAKEKESPTVQDIVDDSKVSRRDVEGAVGELEREGLLERDGDRISLTADGEKAAAAIYESHRTVEDLFGHQTAHAFEHMADRIDYLRRAGEAKPLASFSDGEEGVFIVISIDNPKVLARLIGVGVTPGTAFRLVKKRGDVLVLEVGGRITLVDSKLASAILGVGRHAGPAYRPA